MLAVDWNLFRALEFWQIKSRAFVAGETAAERKTERLEAVVSGRIIAKSKEPGKAQAKFNEYYRKAVTLEDELTGDQAEDKREKHNRALFEELTSGGSGQ